MKQWKVNLLVVVSVITGIFCGVYGAELYCEKELSDKCSTMGVAKIHDTQIICTVANTQ